MVRSGPSRGDELVTGAAGKGKVSESCVEMTQFPSTEPELNAAEAVSV